MSEKDHVRCVHKETGKEKLCPKHWFNDPGIASRLDWVPIQEKKFEETESTEKALAEKEASDNEKAEAEKKAAEEKAMAEKEPSKKSNK